jgi:transposase
MAAGIDLGSTEHWVCCPPTADGQPNVGVFETTTPQLHRLADWLIEEGVDSVAMESTHVYWIPIYEILESRGLEVLLVNGRQLHNVPGRKTDMSDCQWIRLLHSCGLLRGSFRPHESFCRIRALHRQVDNLVAQRTRFVQWMQQALDQMNVQVHRAVTDITGKTGMSIVRAIVDGERDPVRLATLRDKRCRKSEAKIAEHLTGNWRDEHLFNLRSALHLYDVVQAQIDEYEARLLDELRALQPEQRLHQTPPPHPNAKKHRTLTNRGEQKTRIELWRFAGVDLTKIDGISTKAARMVLAEVGLDVSAFPNEKHFVSWLRLSPHTPISGGKTLTKKRNGTGATRIAHVLRMCALPLSRSKTALGAYWRRIARRKGASVAVFSTARKIAILIYRMLRYGQDYVDIGQEAYEAQFRQRRLAGLKSAAESMGYDLVPRPEEA